MKSFLPLAVLVLAGVLLSININKPFVGQHDWNGVVYGQEAKNFARFGYLPLKFGTTLATADTLPEERKFSTHYTPVLPILISFSYRLFGVAEWSTRLIPIAASLVSVGLVMLLGRELISFKAGIMAGVLMAVTPMFIYYGKNPVHEVVLLPFALLGFYSYWRWRQSWQLKWWAILLVSLAAAMLIGWPGYYAAGLIAAHGFLAEGKYRNRFLVLPVLMVILFSVFLLHGLILNSGVNGELWRSVLSRVMGSGFGMTEFVARELRYSINLFTATILGLAGVWAGIFLVRMAKRELSSGHILLLLIGLFGILHTAVFRDAGWYHEYLLFPFLPFVTLAAARVLGSLRNFLIVVTIGVVAWERSGYARALLASDYVSQVYGEAKEFRIQNRQQWQPVPIERDVFFIFYADE